MRRMVWVPLILLSLFGRALPAAAQSVPDLKTLRAKIVATRGAAPDNYSETITATSSDGGSETFHTYKFGKDTRTTVDAGPIHTESGTSGGDDWHQNENGITVVDEPDPSAPSAAESDAGTVTSTADAFVISDLDANGFGLRQFVDPVTYHIVREQLIRRSGTISTAYDAYAAFGNQTLTQHWIRTDEKTGETRTFTRVERVAGSATAAQVAMPGIRRALVDFPNNQAAQIPAKFQDGKVIVQVTIAGHTLDFYLDTGSAGILMDSQTANALGLKSLDRFAATNAQSAAFTNAVVPALTIGTVSMHDIIVATTNLTDRSGSGGFKVAGLLGFDFLATIGVHIDYEHKTVTATPFAAYTPPAGPGVMPIDIRLGQQVPMIAVGLDGVVANRFVVDTGGVGPYTVYDYFMDRHPNVGERSSVQFGGTGVGGAFIARAFTVHSFRLGTLNLQDFDGYRIGQGSYPQAEDGAIGPAFLLLFNVDLDYPHGRIYLTPTTTTKQLLHMR